MHGPLHHHGHAAAANEPPAPEHLPIPEHAAGCLAILAERMRERAGVIAIEADFRDNTLTVRYHPAQLSPDDLNALADDVGAMFAQRVTACEKRDSLDSCAECALRLGRLEAGAEAEFAAIASRGRVGLARRHVDGDGVEVVRPLTGKPWGASQTPAEQEERAKGRTMAALTAACLVGLVAGVAAERGAHARAPADVLYGLSALAGGWYTAQSTFHALRRFEFDVNLLMLLAAVGAAVTGHAFEAAVLMFLFSLSNTLEVYTMGRTRRALHALLKLRPARALVRRGGREQEVEADAVRVGETVIVKPGEAIPVDGTVSLGASLVDQSSLTGESVPVAKNPGDKVFAGTLNQQGAIEYVATRAAGNSALARIVALVREAQEKKSRTEEIAEWVGRYYTVVVIVAAGLMLVLPPLLLGHGWRDSLYRAMTLLVVASPCALVIATPATILSAIANAARNGILFKGGAFIEALGRVRVVAFDKTGTLTHGRFEVTDVWALDGAADRDVLAWAATAETRSPHPLAQAVVRAATAARLEVPPAASLVNHVGKGLVATHAGATIEVGTAELFASLGVPVPAAVAARVRAYHEDAKTAMIVRRAGAWGVIAAADQVRPTAAATLAALRAHGVRRTALLSGDSARTVEAIAARTGVDERHGELLPEDKVRVIGELEAAHGPVAMIGDGINDAPALARATVGVAMGGIGSDAAMESADVVLMGDDLAALPYALALARRARGVVIQNISIATGVMLLLVTWVFAGQFTPLGQLKLPTAVSGHEGSTVVVILNGLRLLRGRR
ncbi:MAG TPA: heavy metal translocating P-type ATPase [Candidatus Eisenbacteria bacterium]|nr:heavy metal translocating P-type ATPase [Candidatus Eisenbacteria bacterium]